MAILRYAALALSLVAAPLAAQSIPLAGLAPSAGPNAQAAQRPLGPNARAVLPRQGADKTAAGRAAGGGRAPYYANCAAAGAVRALPIRQGEPGYGRHLDPGRAGVACE